MEDAYIARVYYESMRDNFEGYEVTYDQQSFHNLKEEFAAFSSGSGSEPSLGELFRIELALLRHLPDEAIKARFWSIEDRFRRVVPQSVIDSYERRNPAVGDTLWQDVGFVRSQSRSLLDVIHANYLINLGREQSTKRLMFIIAVAAFAISSLAGFLGLTSLATAEGQGVITLAVVGMFGAMISIVNRLQKATSRDAMAQDGIFELIGLRTGWVSILMSVCIGGIFALLVYAMVMGGLSDFVFPDPKSEAQPIGTEKVEGTPTNSESGAEEEARVEPAPTKTGNDVSSADTPSIPATPAGTSETPSAMPTPVTAAKTTAPSGAAAPNEAAKPEKTQTRADMNPGNEQKDKMTVEDKRPWVIRISEALRFKDLTEFYKLLVLAFVAGFAERFVPDILNRLGKQGKPG